MLLCCVPSIKNKNPQGLRACLHLFLESLLWSAGNKPRPGDEKMVQTNELWTQVTNPDPQPELLTQFPYNLGVGGVVRAFCKASRCLDDLNPVLLCPYLQMP